MNPRKLSKLWVACAMVAVPMRVDYEQGLCGCFARQQVHHGLCEGHPIWISNVAGIDQKCFFRSDQEIHEGRFERRAKIFAEDECLRIVGMHLQRRLWIFGAIGLNPRSSGRPWSRVRVEMLRVETKRTRA